MKNILKFNHDEKSTILEMHKTATKRNYLTEQEMEMKKVVTITPDQMKMLHDKGECDCGDVKLKYPFYKLANMVNRDFDFSLGYDGELEDWDISDDETTEDEVIDIIKLLKERGLKVSDHRTSGMVIIDGEGNVDVDYMFFNAPDDEDFDEVEFKTKL